MKKKMKKKLKKKVKNQNLIREIKVSNNSQTKKRSSQKINKFKKEI